MCDLGKVTCRSRCRPGLRMSSPCSSHSLASLHSHATGTPFPTPIHLAHLHLLGPHPQAPPGRQGEGHNMTFKFLQQGDQGGPGPSLIPFICGVTEEGPGPHT